MIDKERIKEVESNIPGYLEEKLITKKEEHKKLVDFYIKTAKVSLRVAEILVDLSNNDESKAKLSIEREFECYLLWLYHLINQSLVISSLSRHNLKSFAFNLNKNIFPFL